MRVGIHGRNRPTWTDTDFAVIKGARIETVLALSDVEPNTLQTALDLCPSVEKFIIRLYDPRISANNVETPASFVEHVAPQIDRLLGFTGMFQIHNEPNHHYGVEGWGSSDGQAASFDSWYKIVLGLLRELFPIASFGFPGLAVGNWPHRDRAWLKICRESIDRSDWLGCHTYWQYGEDNMQSLAWGRNYEVYHAQYPTKAIAITEFGNSTPSIDPGVMAVQYPKFYRELMRHRYILSASAFIATSPDQSWYDFVWGRENGQLLPVVQAVGDMQRTIPINEVPSWVAYVVDKLPISATSRYKNRTPSKIDRVVIHHSGTSMCTPIKTIAQYHVRHNNWPGIGYHFVIEYNGAISQTNNYKTISYHAGDKEMNKRSIGICMVGWFTKNHGVKPTDAQIAALRKLLSYLFVKFGIGPDDVIGHKDVVPTVCPSWNWKELREEILNGL